MSNEHKIGSEAFNALPVADKIRVKRSLLLDELIQVGYIEQEERSLYENMRTDALPTDRKGLVIAYYLVGIEDFVGMRDFSLSSIEEIRKTIGATRTQQEKAELLTNIQTQDRIKRAEAFVDSKRRRLKAYLQKFFEIQIALSLLTEPEPTKEGELDAIPYLRDELKKRGYTGADSLSDGDKRAVKETAAYYLDIAEYVYITLLWIERNARRDTYLNEEQTIFAKEYTYENIYDELVENFGNPYALLDNAISNFYGDGTAKGAKDFCNEWVNRILADDGTEFSKTIKGSKFAYLLNKEER